MYSRSPFRTLWDCNSLLFFWCISDDIRLASVAWHSRNEDIFHSEKYLVRLSLYASGWFALYNSKFSGFRYS